MTQEEKKLLIQDLSARLPYEVKLNFYSQGANENIVCTLLGIAPHDDKPIIAKTNQGCFCFTQDHIKPYLRPMSSMSDKEYEEYRKRRDLDTLDSAESLKQKAVGKRHISSWYRGTDWLLEHHFDFRGLIEKGLAIEY